MRSHQCESEVWLPRAQRLSPTRKRERRKIDDQADKTVFRVGESVRDFNEGQFVLSETHRFVSKNSRM